MNDKYFPGADKPDSKGEMRSLEQQLAAANKLLDRHAHDFKQLRDALGCDGSDLPQLLAAIERLKSNRKRSAESVVTVKGLRPAYRSYRFR